MTDRKTASILAGVDRKLRADTIRKIVVGVMISSLVFLAGSAFVYREILNRALVMSVSTCLFGGFVLLLLRRDYLRTASVLIVFFLWLIVSLGIYTAGGLHAPILSGYFAVILLGWILAGMRGGLASFAASLAFCLFIFLADGSGYLPPKIEYQPATLLAVNTFFFVIVYLLQQSASRITQDALDRARTSDEKYRLFLENIPTITYINDLSESALTTYVSPQVEKMIGYTRRELVEDPALWREILHPEDQERVINEKKRTALTGAPFLMEYRLIAKNGSVVWVQDEATLVHDNEKAPEYWLGTWTEITNRKIAEQTREEAVETLTMRTTQLMTASEVSTAAASILELNELLSKVVELIRFHFDYYYVGIFLVDTGNQKAVLRAATGEMGRRMLAANHSLLIGNSSMIGWCIANDQARIALDVGRDAVRFKNPFLPLTRSEIALPLRAREKVIGAMSIQSDKVAAFSDWDIQALQTMANQVANAINTARMFDERTHLLKEMEVKNAELERFTYTVSHDLKSPLVTIRGYLGYLRNDAENGDMERFDKDIERVIKSTETMQTLLQDLLDLSRVGKIINPSDNISIEQLAEETLNLIMSPDTREKVTVKILPSMPPVRADKMRIIEVLQNLVSNSIKFMGKQEKPCITIGSSGLDEASGFPIFYVSDNGIGVEANYHERIFGLFNRLNPEIKGTGIGLALVKRIIEVHGGKIWVESIGQDKGSTFYFTLPPSESDA